MDGPRSTSHAQADANAALQAGAQVGAPIEARADAQGAVPPDRQFARIVWNDRPLELEYQWVGVPRTSASATQPFIVFLHEGLGSLALWKDYPEKFCSASGASGLVFSRYGYGWSSVRPAAEHWPTTFMHQQAHEVLPLLLEALGIAGQQRLWLFGHSDGASIALLHAARFPTRIDGVIAVAPHIFVEDLTIENIRVARETYLTGNLRKRLGRYHAHPDSAFWGWNDVWLDPAFRNWNIQKELANVRCPVLAIQGEDDEYGTLEQVFGIQKMIPAEVVVLPHCGHSPHRDQPDALSQHARRFINNMCRKPEPDRQPKEMP